MNGTVDEALRALIDVQIQAARNQPFTSVSVWIDTAFNGSLVMPRAEIESLGLRASSTTEAILADGTTIEPETYFCSLDWFGSVYRIQVIASDGPLPLLGTLLLAGRRLSIDYVAGKVTLE